MENPTERKQPKKMGVLCPTFPGQKRDDILRLLAALVNAGCWEYTPKIDNMILDLSEEIERSCDVEDAIIYRAYQEELGRAQRE